MCPFPLFMRPVLYCAFSLDFIDKKKAVLLQFKAITYLTVTRKHKKFTRFYFYFDFLNKVCSVEYFIGHRKNFSDTSTRWQAQGKKVSMRLCSRWVFLWLKYLYIRSRKPNLKETSKRSKQTRIEKRNTKFKKPCWSNEKPKNWLRISSEYFSTVFSCFKPKTKARS